MRIQLIILLFLLLVPKQFLAQRPKEVGKETIVIQKGKTDRGNSVLFFEWNIGSNEIFGNNASRGMSLNFDVGYGYFFADRYSFTINSGLYAFANKKDVDNTLARDYRVGTSVRRYFFKRAAFYIDAGIRVGLYKYKTMDESQNQSLVYVTPALGLGYEYLVTDLLPGLNNHLGIAAECTTLISTKKEYKETSIPCFPKIELKFAILYHLNKSHQIKK